jgi:hypothetical protein
MTTLTRTCTRTCTSHEEINCVETIVGSGQTRDPIDTSSEPLTISSYIPLKSLVGRRLVSMLAYLASTKMHILCIRYLVNEYLRDVQIGVTGCPQFGESQESAAIREMGEELGIAPIDDNMSGSMASHTCQNREVLSCYALPIEKCRPISQSDLAREDNRNEKVDDRSKKVWCFVYGDVQEVTLLMAKITEVLPSTDPPGSIVAIPALMAFAAMHASLSLRRRREPFSIRELYWENEATNALYFAEDMKLQFENTSASSRRALDDAEETEQNSELVRVRITMVTSDALFGASE